MINIVWDFEYVFKHSRLSVNHLKILILKEQKLLIADTSRTLIPMLLMYSKDSLAVITY